MSVSVSRLRLGAVRRAGALRLRCRLDGAGICAVRASIAAATARRLGVRVPRGAEQLTIGSGSTTLRAAGAADLRVVLNQRGRTALRRGERRLRVRLAVTTTGPGAPAGDVAHERRAETLTLGRRRCAERAKAACGRPRGWFKAAVSEPFRERGAVTLAAR